MSAARPRRNARPRGVIQRVMPARSLALAASLLAAASVTSVARGAQAEVCPGLPDASPDLARQDATARLRYIQRRLDHGAHRARIWAATWGSLYATSAAVQLVRVPLTESPTAQQQAGLSAGASLLGVTFVVVSPPAILGDASALHRAVASHAPGASVCPLLARAEAYLRRDAANQAFGVGWLLQAGSVVFNLGLGLTWGLAWGDWVGGAITAAVGIAVSEVMTFTQPVDAIDALRRYRAADLRPTTATSTGYWVAAPEYVVGGVGLRVGRTF